MAVWIAGSSQVKAGNDEGNGQRHSGGLARVIVPGCSRHPSQPAPAYEIWNEPNQTEFWDAPGGPNPIAYAALLKAAYPQVKAADPRAPVLGGSITFNDHDFLEDLYSHGGIAGSFDGLALHPYSAANPPGDAGDGFHSFRLAVEQLGQVMAAHGEAGKPIWITEMGWTTAPNYDRAVSETQQATNVRQQRLGPAHRNRAQS